jgi:hypothetical protein
MLPAGRELWRIYFRGGRYPMRWDAFRAFGPVNAARFDHHDTFQRFQERKILYAAVDGTTCLAEVFQHLRVIDRSRGEPWLVGFALETDLTLLDLAGIWPTKAGASMAINTGPRSRAQRWSRTIYDAYPHIHGLWYASSMHANQPAVALYERAEGCFVRSPVFHRPLDDPALLSILRRTAASLGYGLA